MNERRWGRLLDLIDGGMVVPVLGPQVLTGESDDALQRRISQHFYLFTVSRMMVRLHQTICSLVVCGRDALQMKLFALLISASENSNQSTDTGTTCFISVDSVVINPVRKGMLAAATICKICNCLNIR